VSSFPSILKASLGALALLAFADAGARADEPTPAALGYASQLFIDLGMKSSMDQVVPGMLIELEHNVTQTNPAMGDPLRATLLEIGPEFRKSEDGVLADSAKLLAGAMTEQELKDTVTFFESPAGKKFVAVQPAVLQQVGGLVRAWRDKLSDDIMTRARVEMKKKGFTF
jgi:hypothetical protein